MKVKNSLLNFLEGGCCTKQDSGGVFTAYKGRGSKFSGFRGNKKEEVADPGGLRALIGAGSYDVLVQLCLSVTFLSNALWHNIHKTYIISTQRELMEFEYGLKYRESHGNIINIFIYS